MEYNEPMKLEITQDKLVDLLMHAATREDIATTRKELKVDILEVNYSLKEEIVAVKTELKKDIADVRVELNATKTELKEDILRVNNNLTSKICNLEHITTDLAIKTEKLRYEMIKFIVWTGVSIVVTMCGMMAKGFHWF